MLRLEKQENLIFVGNLHCIKFCAQFVGSELSWDLSLQRKSFKETCESLDNHTTTGPLSIDPPYPGSLHKGGEYPSLQWQFPSELQIPWPWQSWQSRIFPEALRPLIVKHFWSTHIMSSPHLAPLGTRPGSVDWNPKSTNAVRQGTT